MDIAPIISSIQASATALKEAYKISEKWKDLEVKKLLIASQNELLNAENAALNLKKEINILTEENMDLKSQLRKKEKIDTEAPELRNNMYWFGDQGPFCVSCFQTSSGKMKSPLLATEGGRTHKGSHFCSVCDKDFGKPASLPMARIVQRKRQW